MTRDSTALIAVDVQADFLPGGSLAVRDGDEVVAPLVALAASAGLVVASRDFHPPNHCSFSAQGGPWPAHCVIGTRGAAIHPRIDAIAGLVVSKGMDSSVEQYSAFEGTRLAEMLRSRGISRLVIGGLATDYCVRATALAGRASGFDVDVVVAAVRAVEVEPGDGERAIADMRAAGAAIV